MASDYASIHADNEWRYGTDIGRIGPMLLADRYDNRTHFIFELLQNAEDALARRPSWEGSRAVSFALSESALRVSHSGKPFDDRDVRSICGIAESTKDLTAIGRFGIGFKSVYAFTDRPEVHSGAEDFAIESFVWPTAEPRVDRGDDETIVVLPLNACDEAAREEIARGLQRLGPSTLLFLRQIEEIAWSVEGGPSGLYLRSKPEAMGENVRRITVIGQKEGKPEIEKTWLVFSREATTDEARKFLQSLGITEPDLVDDVVRNLLPRYQGDAVDVDDVNYDADIRRILAAFATDSQGQREKLLASLRESFFVMAVDAGDGSKCGSKPGEVYLATQRLKELFEGVSDVFLVDDAYACLRGEDVRDLLETCGATRYLRPLRVEVTWEKRQQLRERVKATGTRSEEHIKDYSIHGLELLLRSLPTLELSQQCQKAALLWEALSDLEQRQRSVFTGTYSGQYRRCDFEPAFIELLHDTAWVPDANGNLQQPEFVVFDMLRWKPNPFLLSKIRFKPPIIDQLAREAGIEPGVLDLLKKHGIISVAEAKVRLGIREEPQQPEGEPAPAPEPTPPVPGPTGPEPPDSGAGGRRGSGAGSGTDKGGGGGTREGRSGGDRTGGRTQGAGTGGDIRTPGSNIGGSTFISYVGVHPDDDQPDPDGLVQQARMVLEEKAIAFIIADEPNLQRTPTNNPGYDLFEAAPDAQPNRWCEVKAMTGSLDDRPVGLSRTQFECAREHRDDYWLYVVEHAGDEEARIVRIQDPAGKARTFTFDHGWINVAELDDTAD
jgi:hypothetical protein